jgi:hypothetical protein
MYTLLGSGLSMGDSKKIRTGFYLPEVHSDLVDVDEHARFFEYWIARRIIRSVVIGGLPFDIRLS